MGVWYPSVICNFQLRFDEAFNVIEDRSPTQTTTVGIAAGTESYFGAPVVRPLIMQGSKDNLTQVGARIPKSGTIELNGYRQAHTFDLVFDWRDFPIDPRLIRAARIEIFLGVVQPQDFAKGMVKVNQGGTRDSIISTQLSSTNRTNLLFVGIADEPSVDHGEKGSTISFKGRDVRGLLIDQPADPRTFRDLDLSKDIGNVVDQIVAKFPFGPKINVLVQPEEWPDKKVPSPATVDGSTRVRLGADGKQTPLSTPKGPGDQIKFWDLITKYCNLVGAVAYFVGIDIRIRPLRSVYAQINFDGTIPTPFQGGKQRRLKLDGTTENISIRKFVYGRDVSNLKFSRKLTGTKSPTIECVSIDTSSSKRGLQKLVIGRWPANSGSDPKKNKVVGKAKKTSIAPSGQVAQGEVIRFPIAGIKSKDVLTTIAQNLYEELGRNEIGIAVSTKDFASFNTDDDQDPDMLTIAPGDAVQIQVDRRALSSRNPLVSQLNSEAQKSFGQAVADAQKVLGGGVQTNGDLNLARVLVATARNSIVELQDVFRVKNVKYTLSEGGAVGMDFDAENYIEVRSAAANPKIDQTTKKPVGKSA